ncbi:MAG: non-homologous end-joining DNA ligase [Nocardioidaceae bacterium]|nr:non-homologous end-joining DNA ligase [Nocardioidaceae bacterium]
MQPMLATRGDHVPAGAEWTHEVKWDGIRALVEVRAGRLRIWTRNENEVSVAYPELAGLARLADDLLLDGEIVALGDGVPSFSALADRMHVRNGVTAARLAATNPVTFLAFDLLRLDGEDLTGRPLRERRERLLGLDIAAAFAADERVAWQVPPTYDDGAMLLDAAGAQGLEGIVSKRLSSLYHPGRRSKEWLKFPLRRTGSFLVGGYRHETGSGTRLGAVLVGEPSAGGLVFRGKVGSGLAGRVGQRLGEILKPLATDASPFEAELPKADRIGTTWVRPEVIVDVEYLTLTPDGRLRQPSYRGIRTDLSAADLGDADA